MVAEAAQTALARGIDKFGAGQAHKVKVLDAVGVILLHTPAKGGLVDHLAHVLEDEGLAGQFGVGAEAVALLGRVHDRDGGVLAALEALVLAAGAALALVVDAFDLGGAVDAV